MQIPKQVLAARMPSGAKAVLSAMWQAADTEPPWVPARQAELAKAVALSTRQLRHWIAYLRKHGAIREEAREVLGRRFDGHGLARTIVGPDVSRSLQRKPASSATAADSRGSVAKREKPHTLSPGDRIETDLATIAKHARRSDSHIQICERLLKAKAPCGDGVWHKVKVFRRIRRMLTELGDEGRKSLGAGEIVERWKRTR